MENVYSSFQFTRIMARENHAYLLIQTIIERELKKAFQIKE